MELAGLALGTPRVDLRRLAYAHVRSAGARQWAFVLEPWDAPPAWSDVPAVDLQPALLKAAARAIDAALSGEPDAPPELLLERAFAAGGEALRGMVAGSSAELFAGSGAFAAGLLSTPSGVAIGWVGAARVYRWRGDTLTQLSRDHTLGAEGGDVPAALRDVVVRQLVGASAEVQSLDLSAGEAVVLASSGLRDWLRRSVPLSALDPVQAVAAHLLSGWAEPGVAAAVVARP